MTTENFVTGSCDGGGSQNDHPKMRFSPVRTYIMKRIDTPEPVGCITGALKYVQAIREPVYGRHRLSKTGNYSEQEVSSSAQKERKRRAATRELFEKLSQYYRLAEDDDESDGERDEEKGHQREQMWDSLSLLREGKFRFDHLSR